MEEFIYSISVGVDSIGSRVGDIKSDYSMRIEKYKIKSETNSNYILYDRSQRVKKSDYEKARESLLYNNSKNVRFVIWTKDKEKIKVYKEELIKKITDTINAYRNELKILEDAMNGEIIYIIN